MTDKNCTGSEPTNQCYVKQGAVTVVSFDDEDGIIIIIHSRQYNPIQLSSHLKWKTFNVGGNLNNNKSGHK